MKELLIRLAAPFKPEQISWRVGSTTQDKKKGMALAYIDARDVMVRLDDVCGPENWQRRYPWSDGKRLCCEIGVRCETEWVWKADGAGESDVEAEKGAFSDAFKRAAVNWGIGRYLYDLDSPWVELEPAGKSYKIAAGEMNRLRGILAGKQASRPIQPPPASPTQATPPPSAKTGEVMNDWPAWIEAFKSDFNAAPGYLGAQEVWNAASKDLAALKAYSGAAYSALKVWAGDAGKKKPKEAA